MRSGDMYVTVPVKVWHCGQQGSCAMRVHTSAVRYCQCSYAMFRGLYWSRRVP